LKPAPNPDRIGSALNPYQIEDKKIALFGCLETVENPPNRIYIKKKKQFHQLNLSPFESNIYFITKQTNKQHWLPKFYLNFPTAKQTPTNQTNKKTFKKIKLK
jgi:hypothetical protein